MKHKGAEYPVTSAATPGIWKSQFRICDNVKTGGTEAKLELLATRRTQLKINSELKKLNEQ